MFLSTLYFYTSSISHSIDGGRAFSTLEIWSCVFQSRLFHPCDLVPRFPVPRFQRPRRVQVASAAISVRIHQHLFVAWLLPATLLPLLLLLLLLAAAVVVLFHAMRQLQSTTFNNQLVRCQMTLGPAKQWRVPAEIIFRHDDRKHSYQSLLRQNLSQ